MTLRPYVHLTHGSGQDCAGRPGVGEGRTTPLLFFTFGPGGLEPKTMLSHPWGGVSTPLYQKGSTPSTSRRPAV